MRLTAAATRAHHPSGAVRILYFGSRTWLDVEPGSTAWEAKRRMREEGYVFPGPRYQTMRGQLVEDIGRFGVLTLVEGEADGADLLSRVIASNEFGMTWEPYPVEVAKDGPWPAAGHRRNERMAREGRPVEGRAFMSGLRGEPHSKGSAGMLAILRRRGVPVVVHREDGIELPVHMARRVS